MTDQMIETTNIKAAKSSLRTEAIRARDSIELDIKGVKDKAIRNHLFQTREFIAAKSIMFFASIGSEPNTLDMMADALSMNKSVILPRVDLKARALVPYVIKGLSELSSGYMNIPEPQPGRCKPASYEDIEIIIMPGLAFDKTGGRVGYGGGYYDRFIGDKRGPVLAAIAYDRQIVERVPMMIYDVSVDMIVTESGIIDCREATNA